MVKILKYDELNLINEEFKNSLSKEELFEYMSNINDEITGIDNVVIWVGTKPPQHGHRVKVSNVPDKMDKDNNFTITIPELKVIGNVNKRLINKTTLEQIFYFIKINQKIIIAYSNEELDTNKFKNLLKSVNSSLDEIEKINEQYVNNIFYEELENLSCLNSESTGINNVILWFGHNPYDETYRIRVSNVPNKRGNDDSFTITIPDLNVIGRVNEELITDKVMNKIFDFININEKIIIDYSDFEITTNQFIDSLIKVS
jgi:translation initiation factor 2 beta subunit (eIF-2beta)/eIF-5